MLAKVEAKTASEICTRFELQTGEAKERLTEEISPADFFQKLLEAEVYPDAVQFLAHGLPAREATGWLCLCVREAQGPEVPPDEEKKLAAAERWVQDQSDDTRRQAYATAEETGPGSPAGCACLAAFFSGGSVTPKESPEVLLDPSPTPQMVTGGIHLCAVIKEPEKAQEKYRRFLEIGVKVAGA